MSKTDIWMPLYIADYLADTTRLTTEQHGAYLLLIMDYWRNGPLPNDDAALANITRLSAAAWKKNRPAIARLFQIEADSWRHKRVDDEYTKAIAFRDKQKANGSKGGRPKKKPNDNPKKPTGSVSDNPSESPSPSPSHKTKEAQAATIGLDPAAASPDPIQARSLELVQLLRQRGAAIAAGNPHAIRWAQDGITDAQALSALETAEQRRSDTGSVQPVNAGLLNAIIDDQQRAPPQRKNIHDERADTIAALTGRSRNHEQHESGKVIDITPTAVAG